ncbi:MAG: DNA-3-methyladenine glycosylase I [Candidatus Spechtbacteria bacterium]|nr:DNA-3-methyladenine glycosylase I [Candidatus Spechtbacteria bacterium]
MPNRCPWVPQNNPSYQKYHDKEWGVPVYSDKKMFEFLVLESAQAGLSWQVVLNKRKGYERAFAGFSVKKVAGFTASDIARLLEDVGIIRNRAKIQAAVNNAKRFIEVQKEFGSFGKYAWQFVNGKPVIHKIKTLKDYPVSTKEAEEFSANLKKRGFKFLGPTTIYAHMQATGMVNDHTTDCFRYREVIKLSR